VGGVVINGNQTTTLNGAKIFNGIPLIINSGAKLATGANSLTLEVIYNNGAIYLSWRHCYCKWDDEPSYSGFYYNRRGVDDKNNWDSHFCW
jgi:hypothetical protein